jgi:hypothetical protein
MKNTQTRTKVIIFHGIILLLLLLLSPFTVTGVEATYGWNVDYGHAMEIQVCDAGSPPHDWELNYVQWATSDIFNFFSEKRWFWWDENYGIGTTDLLMDTS